jgi:hypothetical protein
MNSNFRTGHDKTSKFTAENYGTKISVEIDHSDLTLDEVMDVFQTLIIGMGYHENSFKSWVIDRANEYQEEENEKWNDIELRHHNSFWENYTATLEQDEDRYTATKEKLEDWKFDDENIEELENDFFGNYDSEAERRMDIIGQNGNDGLHYRATEEDEAEFDDYGMRIPEDRVGFEWGDEPEDENLFEGDEWEANDKLKAANERYKKALKTLSAKQKKKSK